MYFFLFLMLIMGLAFLVLNAIAEDKRVNSQRLTTKGRIFPTAPLTTAEQPMFFKLADTFPNHVVLAQVSFGALLGSKSQASRGTFMQKRADFVLCTRSFDVVAVIELDDSSHIGRERQDAERDSILKGAGYKVLRYKTIPDATTLRIDTSGE